MSNPYTFSENYPDNKSNEESTMNGTKSIEQVIGELESIAERMKASDFRGILEHNDRGLHDAAFTSVETAVLLLRLAKEDEDVQA